MTHDLPASDMNLTRTLIIGNSGSGKSWLAERIAGSLQAPHIDLDLIHWEPGGSDVARSRERAIELAREAATGSRSWVIEGIYGWLAREVASMTTALIWLCLDESECAVNLKRRGVRRGGTDESFKALLSWSETYRTREGSSSHAGHERLFNDFPGAKTCLRQRSEVTAFADFRSTR
ncbi:adenylate kinase [Rhizobacter sp. Root16D2]|nr:adenylate kinase [Rhizobacter sp. Root29]KQW14670.1 adenylate kinase [Rhizobacter sp. Root1238]KRB24013.1 adenylate kinase [Rhizobacter sp. Root16D2]